MTEIAFHVHDARDRPLSECDSVGSALLACWTHLYDDGEDGPLTIKTADGKRAGSAFESFGQISITLSREVVHGLA